MKDIVLSALPFVLFGLPLMAAAFMFGWKMNHHLIELGHHLGKDRPSLRAVLISLASLVVFGAGAFFGYKQWPEHQLLASFCSGVVTLVSASLAGLLGGAACELSDRRRMRAY